MGKTLAYKILENHLISGDLIPGEEITIKIDPDGRLRLWRSETFFPCVRILKNRFFILPKSVLYISHAVFYIVRALRRKRREIILGIINGNPPLIAVNLPLYDTRYSKN